MSVAVALESVLCSDTAYVLLFTGLLSALSVAVVLLATVFPREQFARGVSALSESNPLAFIAPDIDKFRHSFQIKLAKCGIVMPVKGVHDQSYSNWRTQVTSMYGGPLEFFFCVESEDDPAHPHIQRLVRENPEFKIHCMVAGVNWHCSQKIHNQMHGFERAMRSCEYVIVLDDDIKLHPGTIRSWVEALDSDPQVLAASGYAFEYVQPNERTWSPYFAMLWRLNACTGFTHPEDKPAVLWGGAMMFRSKELKRNIYGITDAWRDGGYSEDFITLSLTRYHGRKIACPKTALFPNRLGSVEFGRFWNFLCRQIYVLMQTYASGSQRFISLGSGGTNATMHAFIFFATLVSSALSLYFASRAVRAGALTLLAPPPPPPTPSGFLGRFGWGSTPPPPPTSAALSLPDGGGAAAWRVGEGDCAYRHPELPYIALGFWLIILLYAWVAKRVLRSFANLCNVLSPHGYDNEPIDVNHVSIGRLAVAYLLYAPLIPAATIAMLLQKSVVWAGVRFTVANGRVASMHRQRPGSGEWYTVPREVSLEKALKELAQFQLEQEGVLR